MKKVIVSLSLFIASSSALANEGLTQYFGPGLCKTNDNYKCITVSSGKNWKTLFPNERERDIVQRLNRTDTYLYKGRKLAVPKNLKNVTIFDISPFPKRIEPHNEKLIVVNQNLLAWGAYDANGELIKWGPISSGQNFCSDINRSCKTITGMFNIFHKKGKGCESSIFPVGRGGSDMPYCMFFYKGYALHGSNEVYGRRASHGCVRLFTRDAKWLNENFVDINTREGDIGTKVIVQGLVIKDEKDKKK